MVTIYGGSGLKGTDLGIPVWGTIYGIWNIRPFLVCVFIGLLVSLVSSYYPAKLASKLKPVECLRFV